MVSHDGQLYEKELGPGSDGIARAMTRFDPDSSWKKVAAPVLLGGRGSLVDEFPSTGSFFIAANFGWKL